MFVNYDKIQKELNYFAETYKSDIENLVLNKEFIDDPIAFNQWVHEIQKEFVIKVQEIYENYTIFTKGH